MLMSTCDSIYVPSFVSFGTCFIGIFSESLCCWFVCNCPIGWGQPKCFFLLVGFPFQFLLLLPPIGIKGGFGSHFVQFLSFLPTIKGCLVDSLFVIFYLSSLSSSPLLHSHIPVVLWTTLFSTRGTPVESKEENTSNSDLADQGRNSLFAGTKKR